MFGPAQEEEEFPINHTGPKGVINDWRKFKLDSMDHTLPQSKRELMRQMSREDDKERLTRKMSAQEYELVQDEDEQCLKRYRKHCMQELHEHLSQSPRFGNIYELDSGEAFLQVIEKEHRLTTLVVHIYQTHVKGCEQMNSCLECLASEYPSVKFCRIDAVATGHSERFSSEVLPAVLVYKAGELLGNFMAITKHFSDDFFAPDVEALLNEYGLLPKKFTESGFGDPEDGDVE
ncbi:phosducin-like [Synchiropus splendidus]|uniref:phosducin-like n=1 Tax=Synchiropus splendidus TaxID=270530 RepID=UPI00237E7281|nr:phosducin-like [Synchiropus splendidus]